MPSPSGDDLAPGFRWPFIKCLGTDWPVYELGTAFRSIVLSFCPNCGAPIMLMTRVHPLPVEPPRRAERADAPVVTKAAGRGLPVYLSVLAAIAVSLLLWAGIIGLALMIF